MSVSAAPMTSPPSHAAARVPSKGSHAYASLKGDILSGRLAPGSSIDKAVLCERLGVSRFPVATALQRLAFEGLVSIAPQHGSFVSRIALHDVLECMTLRRAIEGDTAALAAERQPTGLCAELDRILRYGRVAAEAEDVHGFYLMDVGFHDAILASLDLGHTALILDGLRSRLERIRRILSAPASRALRVQSDHLAVRDAIAAGDGEAARAAMRLHLDDTTAQFRAFADANPTLFSDRTP